jgi:hypothetical protein
MPDDDNTPDWSWFNDPPDHSDTGGRATTGPAAPFVPGPAPGGSSSVFQPPPGGTVAGTSGPVSAPSRSYLWAAAGLTVIALALIPVALQLPLVSVVGWLLGGFLAVGLVSLWSYQQAQARASLWYLEVQETLPLRFIVLGLSVVAVVAHSFLLADWVSRR